MITLTHRAEQHLVVLHALDRGELRMAEAADLLGLSIRQVRRLRRAYRRRGPKALVHGNRGRRSPRRVNEDIRRRIIRLARTTYTGVNHRHFTELLAEREGLRLSHPTVHRILRAAGLLSPRRRRPPRHRRRRERMPQAGMLVQLDGSDHDWLERRGPRLVLLAAIDDATGTVLAASFRDEEDAHGYLALLQALARTHGLPVAIYSDRHGIFHRAPQQPLTLAEQLAGKPAPTQVARALAELGIRWIPARSPQAKGRIERLFNTFQDRLCSELRLAGISDRAGANAYLSRFVPHFNRRFTHPAADPTPAFRPWPSGLDPHTVFCFKYLRVVDNANTIAWNGDTIQLLSGPGGRSYAKATVEVHERLDGSVAIFYHGRCVASQRRTAIAPARVPARERRRPRITDLSAAKPTARGGIRIPPSTHKTRPEVTQKATQASNSRRGKNPAIAIPSADHPWRRMILRAAKSTASNGRRTESLNP
jgi:transposase